MAKWDKYWIGILLGIVVPALFGWAYIERMHLWPIFETMGWDARGVISKICLICVFPDLAMIFLFYTTEWWKLSKGILIGCLPYMIASIAISV